ncbi:hypothetical protein KQX54_016076 [Cotesia glomerata]|uniref:Uncharacterized protein n=1 Tax=Cotesia glomerata TaxID=32391 RepID=A0AAV7HU07_COTGL|nr:hypothetical protein KQX54_016076 [Cotesia glomerata]
MHGPTLNARRDLSLPDYHHSCPVIVPWPGFQPVAGSKIGPEPGGPGSIFPRISEQPKTHIHIGSSKQAVGNNLQHRCTRCVVGAYWAQPVSVSRTGVASDREVALLHTSIPSPLSSSRGVCARVGCTGDRIINENQISPLVMPRIRSRPRDVWNIRDPNRSYKLCSIIILSTPSPLHSSSSDPASSASYSCTLSADAVDP